MNRPPLTPLAALNKCKKAPNQRIMEGGEGEWTYYLDGPQNSPQEVWYPIAQHCDSINCWVPEGEVGETLTDKTRWIPC